MVLSGTFGNITSPLGFGVVNATASGALNWRHVVKRRGNALAAVVDAAGDIVTAGFTAGAFTVSALSRANGNERWRFLLPGGEGAAIAVTVLEDGDVVAGGDLEDADSVLNFTVVRLSGSTGTEIWRRSLGAGSASGLAVDPKGNIVASGETYKNSHFTVVKLAASDGAVLWQQDPTDLLYDVGQAIPFSIHTLATDAAGDVVAAGLAVNFQATVVKLAGADGTPLWRATFAVPPDMIDVDAASDVFVAGATTMAKLSGQTGAELWRRQDIPADGGYGARFVLDSAGDVITAGFGQPAGRRNDLSIDKLAASTGDILWSQTAAGLATAPPANGRGYSLGLGSAVAIDAAGAFLPVGLVIRYPPIHTPGGPCVSLDAVPVPRPNTLPVSQPSLTLFGVKFSDRIVGRSLRVRESSSGAMLVLVSTDPNLLAPAIGSLGDPTQHGALLQITDETAGTQESFALPASGWRAGGRARRGGAIYHYRDAAAASGPCRDVILQSGTLLTARCAGGRPPISFDEAGARTVDIDLTLPGSRFRYCLRFAGTVSAPGTRGRRFTARHSPAPASCPAPGRE